MSNKGMDSTSDRYSFSQYKRVIRVVRQRQDSTITYHSDKLNGPTAGSETIDALELLARVVSHIPNKGQVLQRYYGWYASRVRRMRRRATATDEEHPIVCVEPEPGAGPCRQSECCCERHRVISRLSAVRYHRGQPVSACGCVDDIRGYTVVLVDLALTPTPVDSNSCMTEIRVACVGVTSHH